MIEIRCKNCGGQNRIENFSAQMECEYCFGLMELDDDYAKFMNLYRRADDAWDRKDFDEALQLYEQIIDEDNTQHEAHWGAALCRYGVAYQFDAVREEKMPTCNRVNRTSILDDKNYLAAIKYASNQMKAQYISRAKEIDRISKSFLRIVDQEKPYDVFISYKKSADDGRRTLDSRHARKLYYYLTEQGIKVFFAEETLSGVAGEMYEPYIFAALTSAKVMVLMASCKEYVEAPWVKNEWKRFLALKEENPAKALIPACINCRPEDVLPMGLSQIQAMDATDMVFYEDIAAIVKKKMGAAPQAAKAGGMNLLAEKYATQANVDKVVGELDCDPQLAAEVLILKQGKVNETISYISADKAYQKSLWICTECGRKNTHDVCRNNQCGITKEQSADLKQRRDEAKRQEVEQRRREEEQRRREYERSAEVKRMKAAKRKAAVKKFFSTILVLAILGGIGYGGYMLFTNVIQPAIHNNAEADSYYTPEILKTYSGTYIKNNGDEAQAIVTFEKCSETGVVTGIFEFISDSDYGKYEINCTITEKKNNGKLVMLMEPGEWIVQPDDYIPLDNMYLTFSKDHSSISGSRYSLSLSAGTNTENQIATVEDLEKLRNASGMYALVADIDLAGINWTPIEGFTGTLTGNGFTIRNLTIDASSDNVGFFAELSGRVTNLKFENASVTVSGRHQNIGILCGNLSGFVSDICVDGTVSAELGSYVGGVIGLLSREGAYEVTGLENNADVSANETVGGIFGAVVTQTSYYSNYQISLGSMKNSGTIISSGNYAGGIAGVVSVLEEHSNYTIGFFGSDLQNTGSISGKYYVGGIFGHASSDNTESYIVDCTNQSAVVGEAYVGALAGCLGYITIDNCDNSGSTVEATGYDSLDGVKYAYLGGYVGWGYTVNNCTNSVELNYTGGGKYVGGIMGFANDLPASYETKNLHNTANISGHSGVGGIFGGLIMESNHYTNFTVYIKDMSNSGEIYASENYVGGIAGEYSFTEGHSNYSICLYATDLSNTGSVSGKYYVGGIFGSAISDTDESYLQDCRNESSITGEAYVGTMAGSLENIAINSCSNEGSSLEATGYISVDGVKYAYVGGFAGFGYKANDCTNTVAINYTGGGRYVGGILGFANITHADEITDLTNTADISGASYVGGIFGGMISQTDHYSNYSVTLKSFSNEGEIVGSGDYIAGIIGYLDISEGHGNYKVTLYGNALSNTGSIKGNKYIGGIFGHAKTDSENSVVQDVTATETVSGNSNYGRRYGYAENVKFE